MKRGADRIPEMCPQVIETLRKGFRELYLLDDTWGAGVFLLIGPDAKQFDAWTTEMFGCTDPDNGKHDHAFACAIEYRGTIYNVIVIRDKKWKWHRNQWVTLVHELMHATSDILWRKGLVHTRETEEAWAYLQDSMLNRFVWALGHRNKVLRRPKKRPLAKKTRKR